MILHVSQIKMEQSFDYPTRHFDKNFRRLTAPFHVAMKRHFYYI